MLNTNLANGVAIQSATKPSVVAHACTIIAFEKPKQDTSLLSRSCMWSGSGEKHIQTWFLVHFRSLYCTDSRVTSHYSNMSPGDALPQTLIGTTILEINRQQKTLGKRDGSNNQSRSQGWRVTKYDIFHSKICYIKTKQRGPDGACHGLRAACCHFSSQTRKGLKWEALHFASFSELLSNPFQNLG